jgi:hypothetical protein
MLAKEQEGRFCRHDKITNNLAGAENTLPMAGSAGRRSSESLLSGIHSSCDCDTVFRLQADEKRFRRKEAQRRRATVHQKTGMMAEARRHDISSNNWFCHVMMWLLVESVISINDPG